MPAFQIGDACPQSVHGGMLHTERTLAPEQRTLQVDDRLREVAACRTGLGQLLERDHDGHVMRREHFLANPQRVPVQALRRSVVAESALRDGESGERGRDVGMTLALGAGDLEQPLEHGLRTGEVRLPDVQPAQLVERRGERRVLGAEVPLADA